MKRIALVFLLISLSILSLILSVESLAFHRTYYVDFFRENNIEKESGKSLNELEEISIDLQNYLKKGLDRKILEENFNEKEILHMEDVKEIFRVGYILKYSLILLSIILIVYMVYFGREKDLGKYLFYGLSFNWAFLLSLFLMVYFDFQKYFTYFHLIFFDNDLWLLDPRTDLLIQMMPENFFIGMAVKIGFKFFQKIIFLQIIGYLLMKKGREKHA